jgi:hypothetical protein
MLSDYPSAMAQGDPALGVVPHAHVSAPRRDDLIAERRKFLLDAIAFGVPSMDSERMVD